MTKTLMDNSSKLNSTLDEDLAMARETIQAQQAELEEKMEIISSKISENEALKEKMNDFERKSCKLSLYIFNLRTRNWFLFVCLFYSWELKAEATSDKEKFLLNNRVFISSIFASLSEFY